MISTRTTQNKQPLFSRAYKSQEFVREYNKIVQIEHDKVYCLSFIRIQNSNVQLTQMNFPNCPKTILTI